MVEQKMVKYDSINIVRSEVSLAKMVGSDGVKLGGQDSHLNIDKLVV